MNTAIYSPSGGSVGIAFAIPAATARDVVQKLKDKGKVSSGWLGVQIQNVDDNLAEGLGLKDGKGALIAVLCPMAPLPSRSLSSRTSFCRSTANPSPIPANLPGPSPHCLQPRMRACTSSGAARSATSR